MDTVVSGKTRDHFDFVIDGNVIYDLPNSPDRWPDAGNGGDEPDDPPPTVYVSTKEVFIATQPSVTTHTVEQYVYDLGRGADMPPLACIKCKEGIIVWNGHHRLSAYRLAEMYEVPVRFWAETDQPILRKDT